MPDFKKMTVESLRDLARRVLGPGHSRLKTKRDLVAALEEAERTGTPEQAVSRPRSGKEKVAAGATAKAVRAVKTAGQMAREGARAAGRGAKVAAGAAEERAKQSGRARPSAAAKAAAAVKGAVAGAASAVKARRSAGTPGGGPDPEGYFVARVRGEEAVREAPHPLGEDVGKGETAFRAVEEGPPRTVSVYDEGLGDLPWSYGDDAFVALPRDPRSMFLYWDHSRATLHDGFAGLEHPWVQLWIFVRSGEGWDRIRALDFALEARGYYVHDLDPGRTYRAEIHVVDGAGRERLLGRSSNEVGLPAVGPSPIIDDRFIRIPWDVPLGRLLGPGHAGGPFSDEARHLLSRLSDWSRFGQAGGGSAGGMGGRPSSPTGGPSSPSSPFGPPGGGRG
jgi:uncharacterized protein